MHMVLWYNVIVAFASESDSVGSTELKTILSNWEEVSSQNLRIRTFILFGT